MVVGLEAVFVHYRNGNKSVSGSTMKKSVEFWCINNVERSGTGTVVITYLWHVNNVEKKCYGETTVATEVALIRCSNYGIISVAGTMVMALSEAAVQSGNDYGEGDATMMETVA